MDLRGPKNKEKFIKETYIFLFSIKNLQKSITTYVL